MYQNIGLTKLADVQSVADKLARLPENAMVLTRDDGQIYAAVSDSKVSVKNTDTTGADFTDNTVDLWTETVNIRTQKDINVTVGGSVNVTVADNVSATVGGQTDHTSGGNVNVQGANINLNC